MTTTIHQRATAERTDDEIRELMLQYFYDRNHDAASRRGKSNGAAVTISVLRSELKEKHGLTAQEVHRNLTYLESQGWVEDRPLSKTFKTNRGGLVPAVTSYYIITAAGIDRIGGPSAFKRDRFHGIRIEATGQSIITLGDGNQVNAEFRPLGEALAELRSAIKSSELSEDDKLNVVVDIDTLQAQLARPSPSPDVISRLWEGINRAASLAGLGEVAVRIGSMMSGVAL